MNRQVEKAEGILARCGKCWEGRQKRYPFLCMIASKLFSRAVAFLVGVAIAVILVMVKDMVNVAREQSAERNAIQALRKTREQYKTLVIKDLKRNIRVLQHHIWAARSQWRGDIPLRDMSGPYVTFFTSQDTLLRDVYGMEIDIFGEIMAVYQTFDGAQQRIQTLIHSHSMHARLSEQDVDYFIAAVEQAIPVLKKLQDSMGDSSYQAESYLDHNWSEPDVLDKNSREFAELERRKIATGPVVELAIGER